MKKLLIAAIVLLTQTTFAQVTKNLGDFNTVKVFDKLNVKLIESSENKVVISGNRQDEVEAVNNNGELKLRMPFPKLLSGNDISIKLYYKSIDGVAASEGAYVSSDETFESTIMDLNAREGAEIHLNLDVDKVNIKAVTGGIIAVSGKAINQDVVLMTGGILESKDLVTSQTSISVSAGGNAEIYATTLVDAKIKAGGTIFIYGKPKQINKETLLGGKIEEKN
ncbi:MULTISPECIES: head GIN domain-containing protein [unclassified Flavobacterium]|uniref:head GIN domain-containing protein n=1 Tax=unclassified Flavobacterium TaxID=196869 RepID=UPI003F92054D